MRQKSVNDIEPGKVVRKALLSECVKKRRVAVREDFIPINPKAPLNTSRMTLKAT